MFFLILLLTFLSEQLFALSIDYEFPVKIDRRIHPLETILKGRIYLPEKGDYFPVVMIRHGSFTNCARADYLQTRTYDRGVNYIVVNSKLQCPDRFVKTDSHLGYEYIADRLVEAGFAVVSIDASWRYNFPDPSGPLTKEDKGLFLSASKHMIAHFELLDKLNQGRQFLLNEIGNPVSLEGQFDFSRTSLLGHSRGGPTIRLVYEFVKKQIDLFPFLKTSNLKIESIVEIAPVDVGAFRGYRGPKVNTKGLNQLTILGSHDPDTKFSGIRLLDRDERNSQGDNSVKSAVVIDGGNHANFNSRWTSYCTLRPMYNGCFSFVNSALYINNIINGRSVQRSIANFYIEAFLKRTILGDLYEGKKLDSSFQNTNLYSDRPDAFYIKKRLRDPLFFIKFPFATPSLYPNIDMDQIPHRNPINNDEVPFQWKNLILREGFGKSRPTHDTQKPQINIYVDDFREDAFLESLTSKLMNVRREDVFSIELAISKRLKPEISEYKDFDIQLIFSDNSLSKPVRFQDFGLSTKESSRFMYTSNIPLSNFFDEQNRHLRGYRFTFRKGFEQKTFNNFSKTKIFFGESSIIRYL